MDYDFRNMLFLEREETFSCSANVAMKHERLSNI